MRLLVTDGSYRQALGIVRSLGDRHEVFVCSPRSLAIAAASRYAAGHLRCPPPSDEEQFVSWLDGTVRRLRVDQVIPVGAASCAALARSGGRWPGVRVVLPAAEKMALAFDKRRTLELAATLGLPVPRSEQPESIDDLDAVAARVGFPLVLKRPLEGSSGVAYVDTAEELRDAVAAYIRRYPTSLDGELPLLQQRIVGPGFGVFVTYQNGTPRRIMAHRRVRESPPTGGESSCCELYADETLFELACRMMSALEWHGVAMVEFKRHDADGRYYLMEVNPKFWGSLDLALAAGADFPGDLVRIAEGEELPRVAAPNGPLRFCWPLSTELRHLRARPSDIGPVLRDWLNPRTRTNVRPTDPLPGLLELAIGLGRAVLG